MAIPSPRYGFCALLPPSDGSSLLWRGTLLFFQALCLSFPHLPLLSPSQKPSCLSFHPPSAPPLFPDYHHHRPSHLEKIPLISCPTARFSCPSFLPLSSFPHCLVPLLIRAPNPRHPLSFSNPVCLQCPEYRSAQTLSYTPWMYCSLVETSRYPPAPSLRPLLRGHPASFLAPRGRDSRRLQGPAGASPYQPCLAQGVKALTSSHGLMYVTNETEDFDFTSMLGSPTIKSPRASTVARTSMDAATYLGNSNTLYVGSPPHEPSPTRPPKQVKQTSVNTPALKAGKPPSLMAPLQSGGEDLPLSR